jgi:pyrroline-5-carboxylate reductase
VKRIGIIGFGNMGEALAAGLIKEKGDYEIIVSEAKQERIKVAKENYSIAVVEKKSLFSRSDIVVIAVKPQELTALFEETGELARKKKLISIVAGRKISFFQQHLGTDMVTRFMPNLAAMEGKALVGISFAREADEDFRKDCTEIAEALGTPCELPESLLPAVTGLSGSGIAFVFAFIHAMALGGVASGIPYATSITIALKTIEGACAVMGKRGEHPIELLSKVISPAGTTIAGVCALEAEGFTYAVIEAIERATERAKELEG